MTKLTFELPVFDISPSYMIGPTSREIDSWRPAPVLKILPSDQTAKATITLSVDREVGVSESQMPAPKAKTFLVRRPTPVLKLDEGRLFVDFRRSDPTNWSHALNNHLPYLFLVCDKLGIGEEDRPGVLLPEKMTRYCKALFDALGVETICTDAPAQGRFIRLEVQPWHAIRGSNVSIVKSETRKWPLFDAVRQSAGDQGERLFMSRKSGRAIENEAQIEAMLSPLGFRKVYMEDFDPLEQISIVAKARDIVAVHGAALGLLIYNAAFSEAPPRVVEIFSPGYVVNPFRTVTQQLGGHWMGVHGRITPEMLDYLNDGEGHAREFTMANTKVDPASLKLAMEMLFQNKPPQQVEI